MSRFGKGVIICSSFSPTPVSSGHSSSLVAWVYLVGSVDSGAEPGAIPATPPSSSPSPSHLSEGDGDGDGEVLSAVAPN